MNKRRRVTEKKMERVSEGQQDFRHFVIAAPAHQSVVSPVIAQRRVVVDCHLSFFLLIGVVASFSLFVVETVCSFTAVDFNFHRELYITLTFYRDQWIFYAIKQMVMMHN